MQRRIKDFKQGKEEDLEKVHGSTDMQCWCEGVGCQ